MAGVKGRSGRKRNVRNIQKYFNEQFDLRSSSLIETLLDEAEKGSAAALVYAFDRRFGKPKQQTEIEIPGAKELGAGLVIELFKLVAEERRKLLQGEVIEGEVIGEGSTDAIQR